MLSTLQTHEEARVSKFCPDESGHDRLWGWFGLSRAAFLTLPRVLMHEMPDDWQRRMADLLEEFDREFPNSPAGATVVKRGRGAWPDWLLNYRHPRDADIDTARKAATEITD